MGSGQQTFLNETGYLIRRCHQINQALFFDEVSGLDLTPVQVAALRCVCESPGIDQRRLADTIGIDEATLGGVVRRLVARGLMERLADTNDRRIKRLKATQEGAEAWTSSVPGLHRLRDRLLSPLNQAEAETLRMLLARLVGHHEAEVFARPKRNGGKAKS